MNLRLAFGLPLAAAALVLACTGSPSGPSGSAPGVFIVAQPVATDTVDATPIQALVVEVRDSAGKPLVDATVRFTSLPVTGDEGYFSMYVSPEASNAFGILAAVTTNSRGRATALVRYGVRSGKGGIGINVPEFGFLQTFTTTIQPGQVSAIQLSPTDTALTRGASMQLRPRVTDRYGNPRSDPVAFEVASGGSLASVSSTGAVTTSGYGRVSIRATLGRLQDSAAVSIVPSGVFAAADVNFPYAIVVANLDGSNRRAYPLPSFHDIGYTEPTWLPDGSGLVYVDSRDFRYQLMVLGLDGTTNPVFSSSNPVLGVQLSPTVSPDGQTFYFSGGNVNTGLRTIWRVRRDGTGAGSYLGPMTGGDFNPSADSKNELVAFHTAPGPIRFLVAATGQVMPLEIPGLFPEFSPDGNRLSLVTGESVAVVNVDGTGYRVVTAPGRRYAQLNTSWSPDGEWLLARGEQFLELLQVSSGLRLPLPWTPTLTHPAWKPAP